MLLVTDNNQGELSPLEIGMHALNYVPKAVGGRGLTGGLSEYAGKLGKDKGNVSRWKNAAEVANCCIDTTVLLDKAQHLAAIHALPESCCWRTTCKKRNSYHQRIRPVLFNHAFPETRGQGLQEVGYF